MNNFLFFFDVFIWKFVSLVYFLPLQLNANQMHNGLVKTNTKSILDRLFFINSLFILDASTLTNYFDFVWSEISLSLQILNHTLAKLRFLIQFKIH